jgi:streptogramin lyase
MKKLFFFFFLFSFFLANAQQNEQWRGYFSYNKIVAIAASTNRIFAAAENSFFTKNILSNEIKTTNTVDGLSGEDITSIYHSDAFQRTILGYKNGLMIVVNDSDGSVLKVVDIINKNIPNNIKKVNHFMEFNGILYVSCDFGIVQYNIQTLQFGDTYFIGPNGQEIKVTQTTVFNNEIYAVTQLYGIKKAGITNPNLNDFNQWQTFDSGNWIGIATLNNQIVAANLDTNLYRYNGTNWSLFAAVGQAVKDFKENNNRLIVTTPNKVVVYNSSFALESTLQNSFITSINVTFSCGTVINNIIYAGTNENGIITAPLASPSFTEILMPDGPLQNKVFAINAKSQNLWVTYGGYDIFYNPYEYGPAGLVRQGISKYASTVGWLNIPYNQLSNASSLCTITTNKNQENQIYIGSYDAGLLKIEDDVATTLYSSSNSPLQSLSNDQNNIRINASAFDRQGNLWVTNSRVNNGLKVLRSNGQWQSYNMSSISSNIGDLDFDQILVDNSGTKWMATYRDGVVAFNENTNQFKKITEGADLGNLPTLDVRAIAIDNRSQLWIGTNKGLRVLSSTSSFNSENQMKANAIIILEDGLAQELLFEQFITDIEVDGSNRKWIATADSGAFLFSENGQETIYHFTTENSPLPTNTINDIDINPITGEIFFATEKGIVSFQGTATSPKDNLDNVYVYPNPVRPGFDGTVKVAGLIADANIKITDIEGNLVFETTSEGGTIEWDTTAFGKYKVASGVYMIFIAAEDGVEVATRKVMIIR